MGFAELLIRLGIPYGSAASVALAEELMAFVAAESRRASRELAAERGVFPAFDQSAFAAAGEPRRNATLNSIAPTGTLAILAGTSPGIEPLFGLVYRREGVLNGERLLEVNPLFARLAAECGVDLEQVVPALAARGRLAEVPGVPEPLRALFRTALEIPPEEHLAVQAAFQRHVDNAVSKTVNLPHDAPPERVASIYRAAWEAGVKGITVYRYGSRDRQVMQLGAGEPLEAREHFARCDPHDCRL
ncbi:MAG: hypothetical protein KatS3mg124_1759 [Porticoccaceae bacterium]|nr:MAG: hypothetical protein KatS3mg124_1759 [Porticoccaceae bacterium]